MTGVIMQACGPGRDRPRRSGRAWRAASEIVMAPALARSPIVVIVLSPPVPQAGPCGPSPVSDLSVVDGGGKLFFR